MVVKRKWKVVHGHPRITHNNPKIAESDTPSELTSTKQVGRKTDRVNIIRTNRKRNKRSDSK